MRFVNGVMAAALVSKCCTLLAGTSAQVVPALTVGVNLETPANVVLGEAAPGQGLDVTIHSGDDARLRFAKRQDQAGSSSLTLHVNAGMRSSPEFWAQAFGDAGYVPYAVSIGQQETAGSARITPSGMIIVGPMRAPRFLTTTRSTPTTLHVVAVRLDDSGKIAEEQFVAGGRPAHVAIANASRATGGLTPAQLDIPGGSNTAVTLFQPSAEGEAALSASVPPGFSQPAEFASVTAVITIPGLALSKEIAIGQNLELRGILSLGAAAPPGGVNVTLTSNAPDRLLLAKSAVETGSESITVNIPANAAWAPYYLQALGDSGEIQYRASAPGFRPGSATVTLAPSGVVLTPNFQGPPDEAQILSKDPGDGNYRFSTSLSNTIITNLVAWTVQLDPVTHRSADITVQPLRGGLSLDIPLVNSDPKVGKIGHTLNIQGGSEHSIAVFSPLAVGSTEISVTTPKPFTVSANSTKVTAIVIK